MKKASKNTNAKRGASRRTMWIITAVVLIPAAIILWNTTGRPLVTQADMKRYLEDKYKKKFEEIRADIIENMINPIVPGYLIDSETRIFVNSTGRFVKGGPMVDTGLTGRKIIVDTYGGWVPHDRDRKSVV